VQDTRYNPAIHHRRSIRLKGWDYRQPGAYFVTLVTEGRDLLFGDVANGAVALAFPGTIAETLWLCLPQQFAHVRLDEFVVMPNHLHGLIWLTAKDEGAVAPAAMTPEPAPPQPRLLPGSLGAILGNYKSLVTRRINAVRHTPGGLVWQSNYYEHIIRNGRALEAIREYIHNNPSHWERDPDNPLVWGHH